MASTKIQTVVTTSSPVARKASTKRVAKPAAPATNVVTKPAAKVPAKQNLAPKVASQPITEKPLKAKKIKMVRDSFTMPKPEFSVLDVLKLRAAQLSAPIKKTELIRAGIKALAAMTDADFLLAIRAVPNLKTGRPAKA